MRGASRWSQNPDPEEEEEEKEKRAGGLAAVAAARTTNPVSRDKTAAHTTRPASPRSRRRCSAAVVYPVWERRLGALWDAACCVHRRTKGKGFAGGAEGFSCCEAAEQPIETKEPYYEDPEPYSSYLPVQDE